MSRESPFSYAHLPDLSPDATAETDPLSSAWSPAGGGWGNPLGSGGVGSSNPEYRPIPGRAVVKRFKKGRLMKWLILHKSGGKQLLTLDKRQLIDHFRLDIPVRDMRLMDSVLGASYDMPGQLLVRDDALVLSMEYVRLIIAADKVIVPLEDDKVEEKDRFLSTLEAQLHDWQLRERHQMDPLGEAGLDGDEADRMGHRRLDDEGLPFELKVLETALGEVCAYLGREASSLQASAGPVLEDLTKDSNRANLERVRRVKTMQSRLAGRVKAMGESLEKLMEDDGDMWRMCLHARQQQQKRPSTGLDGAERQGSSPTPQRTTFGSMRRYSLAAGLMTTPGGDMVVEDTEYDVSDVEALLESYFIQLESTFQTLARLGEYIEDTEELISMALDWSRNRLIRFEILLTTGTFVLAFFSMVAGVLGENLVLPESWIRDLSGFIIINSCTAGLALACFLLVLWGLKAQKLI